MERNERRGAAGSANSEPSVPTASYAPEAEWLEADGLGGFASGTVHGIRTRRYHALLLTATTPPTGRIVLVNGFEAWLETDRGRYALTSQRYAPDIVHPDGATRLKAFAPEPWPTWRFAAEDGTELTQEILAVHGRAEVILRWRLSSRQHGAARLVVRPLLSGRDYHALHRDNDAFDFRSEVSGTRVAWRPYMGLPAIEVVSNAAYAHEPVWYRNFLYAEEQRRGLDCIEDLAAPGLFAFDLAQANAVMTLRAAAAVDASSAILPEIQAEVRIAAERARRARFASPLQRGADAYIVARGDRRTLVAGYPWFTDWGRDTFIAMRGICATNQRLGTAREILLAWADSVSDGMLPNRFPDAGGTPEYNAVDASLWFIIAAEEYFRRDEAAPAEVRTRLWAATDAILAGYAAGTRFGIRLDGDGLIAAGEPGMQLTWMDAKVGDWVVTPRIGKPVEVQALWLNALKIARRRSPHWDDILRRGLDSFEQRFWREEAGCLHDVVDADHVPGKDDPAFRANQIFAVGGLPYQLLHGARAQRLLKQVEQRLLTPIGLRSLAPGEPGYCARYAGSVRERDAAYHQGTVWPWLIGPFVEAWLRVNGASARNKSIARERFLHPVLERLGASGIGHLPEVADAEPPHRPGGCPFQAWSLGELLRIELLLQPRGKAAQAAERSARKKRAPAPSKPTWEEAALKEVRS